MFAAIMEATDSLAAAIPSFTDRFNFALPLIVVLLIVMFFILLKTYNLEQPAGESKGTTNHERKTKK